MRVTQNPWRCSHTKRGHQQYEFLGWPLQNRRRGGWLGNPGTILNTKSGHPLWTDGGCSRCSSIKIRGNLSKPKGGGNPQSLVLFRMQCAVASIQIPAEICKTQVLQVHPRYKIRVTMLKREEGWPRSPGVIWIQNAHARKTNTGWPFTQQKEGDWATRVPFE
jgi:hypothetical protein